MTRTFATLLIAMVLASACASGDDEPDAASGETTTPAPAATAPTATTPAPEPSEALTTAPTSPPPTPEPEDEVTDGTVITTGDSEFGEMLFDANDQAIYMFDVEQTSTPDCYDDCAVAWPPVLTDGTPQADGNLDADLLGTTERTDGSIQVTYNDHPLYYYAHEAPGEVKCHNIDLNGGLWYVLQPDGDPAPPG